MRIDLEAMGTRVRRARESAGHGLRELADTTGIPRAHLSRLEDGKQSRATLEQLNLLAQTLDVSLQHLLCGSTSSRPGSAENTVSDTARTLTHS